MRLNYYEFPDGMSEEVLKEYCEIKTCYFFYEGERKTIDEMLNVLTEDGTDPMKALDIMDKLPKEVIYEKLVAGCSITFAKQLLKLYGGKAWTEHYERDGGCFEVTPIRIKGNNSRAKYNHHL